MSLDAADSLRQPMGKVVEATPTLSDSHCFRIKSGMAKHAPLLAIVAIIGILVLINLGGKEIESDRHDAA